MTLRSILVVLATICLTFAPTLPQEIEKPPLECEGVLVTQKSAWAIVGNGESLKVLERGEKIGDYTLESVSEEGVTIRYVGGDTELAFSYPISAGEEQFELELPAIKASNLANSVIVSDFGYLVQALSKAFAKQTIVCAEASFEVVGVMQDNATFEELLAEGLPEGNEVVEIGDLTVVCATGLSAGVRDAKPISDSQKQVTLDFVHAELVYVLKVLAKEIEKDIVLSPDVEGAVTVQVQNRLASSLVPLVLLMQEEPPALKEEDGILLIGPIGRVSPSDQSDSRLDKAVTLDFVNADLAYVLMILAQEAGLEPYVQREMAGSVTATLKSRSVVQTLSVLLAAQKTEHHWKVENDRLIVWTDAPEDCELLTPDNFFDE